MSQAEELSRMTVQLPAKLKRQLKMNAVLNDRSLAKEILHTLKTGLSTHEAENASKK